ncbi:O-unit flippase [Clostridium sp.]|uniref:lipopolysaccharide biosynthesis protein n=1 Tax=Clostridium sp. TaxID=1506 RepID=UPI003216FC6A
MSRTGNVKKNVIVNLGTYLIVTILTFIQRRYFIHILGDDIAGINAVFANIIGFLSIADLGIGIAITFALYEPIAENDKIKIKGLINLYAKLYRGIALIILVLGVIVSFILPILIKGFPNMGMAKVYYFLYLINTIISYMFSYKSSILYASQKLYIVSLVESVVKIIKLLIQIFIIIFFNSYLFVLIVEIMCNMVYYAWINKSVNKLFPWLNKTQGYVDKKTTNQIVIKIKALFYHKIGSFIVFNTDNLAISYFTNLFLVNVYSNYNMIISFLSQLLAKVFDATTASIGNLLVEGNEERAYDVFRSMYFINFWIVTYFTCCFYNMSNIFITIWIGKQYILNTFVLLVVLINFYITSMRISISKFQDASGIYEKDKYAPIFEGGINLVFTIILGSKMGLIGIFIGTLISNVSVIMWIKPYIVYKNIFHKGLIGYFKEYAKYFICMCIILVITNWINGYLDLQVSILNFILLGVVNTITINGIIIMVFHKRIKTIFKEIMNKRVIE